MKLLFPSAYILCVRSTVLPVLFLYNMSELGVSAKKNLCLCDIVRFGLVACLLPIT